MDSAKEGRGGFSRFGRGRGGSEPESNGEGGGSGSPTATATADKPAAAADVVTAPAISDGEVPAPSKPMSAAPANGAPVNSSASNAPVNASVGAPAKATVAAKAAEKAPMAKVPSAAPSRASAARAEKAEPAKSDAPIPRSRLGRTKGSDAIRAPRVRRARLKIANIDPWSVMKVSFLFSVALGVILLVAVALLWLLLDFMGFFSTVASTVSDISGDEGTQGFDVVGFFSLPRVLGMATIVALVDIVMITALTTLAAYLYNISTDLVGGVEVTLAEEE